MIIREVRLRNFRSYKEQSITFGPGSTLLSGDIGSGKSSILLAVEFALFGIMRGILAGETLLRAGEDEGDVSLTFSLGNDTVTIKRGLRRKGDAVQQSSGFLIVNGRKEELMPSDLKARVMALLGYPKGLASQHKGLVYRYTVYTPQEEMKQILLEHREARLDILRKVFGIERYKAITDNAAIVNRAIRERIRELEGRTADLPEKLARLESEKKGLEALSESILRLAPALQKAKELFSAKNASVLALEKEREDLMRLKRESTRLEERLESLIREKSRNNAELERIEKDIASAPKVQAVDLSALQKRKEELMRSLSASEEKAGALEKSIGAALYMVKQSSGIIEKISSLRSCPTCEQEVSGDHKALIRGREEEKQKQSLAEKEAHEKERDLLKSSQVKVKEELEAIQSSITKGRVLLEQEKAAQERLRRKAAIDGRNEEIRKEIGEVNQKKMAVRNTVSLMEGKESEYLGAKKALEEAREEFHAIDKKAGIISQQKKDREAAISLLQKELGIKDMAKKKLEKARERSAWIEEKFLPAIQGIERSIMRAVHREFSSLFTQWFNVLIDDETMSVRLDEGFTPIVIQNGYEIDVSGLSGGERTSCALAYRLALNKVINDIIDTIKTRDIIILDEPTDGFSTEQLDRVRDLLEQIRISQVIIVSHESKIESFVERVIRIEKHDHTSSVLV